MKERINGDTNCVNMHSKNTQMVAEKDEFSLINNFILFNIKKLNIWNH
jgi:hypothetical protein